MAIGHYRATHLGCNLYLYRAKTHNAARAMGRKRCVSDDSVWAVRHIPMNISGEIDLYAIEKEITEKRKVLNERL